MKHSRSRLIGAGVIGNAIEYYDFALIGFLAVAIGKNFFPSTDPVASTLWAFAAFAAGMLMRPIGGAIFGHIGDRISRKTALLLSLALMSLPTFFIGLLPTYDQIGIAAAVLLVALRLLQGLSVGGEYASSIVYLIEQAPQGRKNIQGAFVSVGAKAGMSLGSAVCAAMLWAVGADAMNEWGWRVPFLLSLPLLTVGLWLRRALHDDFVPPKNSTAPVVELSREHKKLFGFLLITASAIWVHYYFVFIYMPSWLTLAVKIPQQTAQTIGTAAILAALVGVFCVAWLSDRFGGWRVLRLSTALLMTGIYPALSLMTHGYVWAGAMIAAFLLAAVQAPIYAAVPLALPRHLRASGSALVFGLAAGVVGGLAPLAFGYLVRISEEPLAPAFVIASFSLCASVALFFGRKIRT